MDQINRILIEIQIQHNYFANCYPREVVYGSTETHNFKWTKILMIQL